MESIVGWINGILWGPVTVYGILLVGLLFSIMTRFVQVRQFKEMFSVMFKGEKSDAGVSSFQALSIALSGRIGTGNIIGTASAIAFGGPGAVFWMWVTGMIGASSAFVESTLAQIYKEKKNGLYRGGPAFYIEKGTGIRALGVIFAIAAIIAMAILMPGVQSNAIASTVETALGIEPKIMGIVTVVIIGFIIIGGVKRIANAAEIIVPFMAAAYVLMAIIIIAINIQEVPAVFALIFKSAFNLDATFSGMLGAAIAWGVKRALYANEAGQGTGAHPAAAAEVSHPVKQGLVQTASIYIDTMLICTATALMILFTGQYNVHVNSSDGPVVVENVPGSTYADYTQLAVTSAFPTLDNFGAIFVAVALFFFAFTTIMAYYYIAETNVSYLFNGSTEKIARGILKIVLLVAIFFGTIRTSDLAWAFGDIGLGIMVWINIVAMLFISKPTIIALRDYEQQKREGKDPVFDPEKLGIKNADYWIERKQEKISAMNNESQSRDYSDIHKK